MSKTQRLLFFVATVFFVVACAAIVRVPSVSISGKAGDGGGWSSYPPLSGVAHAAPPKQLELTSSLLGKWYAWRARRNSDIFITEPCPYEFDLLGMAIGVYTAVMMFAIQRDSVAKMVAAVVGVLLSLWCITMCGIAVATDAGSLFRDAEVIRLIAAYLCPTAIGVVIVLCAATALRDRANAAAQN